MNKRKILPIAIATSALMMACSPREVVVEEQITIETEVEDSFFDQCYEKFINSYSTSIEEKNYYSKLTKKLEEKLKEKDNIEVAILPAYNLILKVNTKPSEDWYSNLAQYISQPGFSTITFYESDIEKIDFSKLQEDRDLYLTIANSKQPFDVKAIAKQENIKKLSIEDTEIKNIEYLPMSVTDLTIETTAQDITEDAIKDNIDKLTHMEKTFDSLSFKGYPISDVSVKAKSLEIDYGTSTSPHSLDFHDGVEELKLRGNPEQITRLPMLFGDYQKISITNFQVPYDYLNITEDSDKDISLYNCTLLATWEKVVDGKLRLAAVTIPEYDKLFYSEDIVVEVKGEQPHINYYRRYYNATKDGTLAEPITEVLISREQKQAHQLVK